MNIYTLSVACAWPPRPTAPARPKLNFCADWLPDNGFIPGALVQALPEPGGMSFILRDEYIMKYSDLLNATKEKGGALITVSSRTRMDISGKCVSDAGLDIGDPLLGIYGYGLIKTIKLPGNARVIPVGKDKHTVRLTGAWMTGLGFAVGSAATAAISPGSVTFKLHEAGADDYHALVKYSRQSKGKVAQVHMKGYTQCLEVSSMLLEKSGFSDCDAFIATCERGVITVTPFHAEQLGFDKSRGLAPHYID